MIGQTNHPKKGAKLIATIIETNIIFKNVLALRRNTRRAIIHHSASGDVSAATINEWHLARGWSGIGYHLVIREDGSIERGRPINSIGAHSGTKGNGDSVGIVLTGNFEIGHPTPAQIDSLVWVINQYLKPRYGNIDVQGHKDVMSTACPGKNFPWAELRKRLEVKPVPDAWKTTIMIEAAENKLIDLNMGHQPDEPATKWFVLAVALNLLKEIKTLLRK